MESFNAKSGQFLYFDESENSSSDTQQSPTSNNLIDCPYCFEVFPTVELLRIHKAVHYKNKQYLCKLCNASYTSPMGWQYHYRSHNTDLQYSCDSCDMKFCAFQALVKHIQNHRYFCSSCNEGFGKRVLLRLHRRNEHQIMDDDDEANSPTEHRCPKCHVNFRLLGQLRKHMKESEQCKLYSCDGCGKGFMSLIHLQSHMAHFTNCGKLAKKRKRNKSKDKISKTEIVGRVDRPYERTSHHIEEPRSYKEPVHHIEESKSYFCNNCDLTFPKIQLRRDHWIRNELCRPYWCNDCESKFFNKTDLEMHVRKHSFKCLICLRRFLYKKDLDDHCCKSQKESSTDKVISSVKNFECQYCCETYFTEEELQFHIEYVSKYLYICSKCSDTFKNECTFGYHLITAHGIDRKDV